MTFTEFCRCFVGPKPLDWHPNLINKLRERAKQAELEQIAWEKAYWKASYHRDRHDEANVEVICRQSDEIDQLKAENENLKAERANLKSQNAYLTLKAGNLEGSVASTIAINRELHIENRQLARDVESWKADSSRKANAIGVLEKAYCDLWKHVPHYLRSLVPARAATGVPMAKIEITCLGDSSPRYL